MFLRNLILPILFIITIIASAKAEVLPFGGPYPDSLLSSLREGKILIKSTVNSHKEKRTDNSIAEKQQFDFEMTAFHPRSCRQALRKLSMYENFKEFITFVSRSDYNEATMKWTVILDHALFYGKLYLSLSFPRVKEAGIYPFTFLSDSSMPGMTGRFIFNDFQNGCIIDLKSHYNGPTTTFPDTVFQIITSTLGRLGMEKLIRISTI